MSRETPINISEQLSNILASHGDQLTAAQRKEIEALEELDDEEMDEEE